MSRVGKNCGGVCRRRHLRRHPKSIRVYILKKNVAQMDSRFMYGQFFYVKTAVLCGVGRWCKLLSGVRFMVTLAVCCGRCKDMPYKIHL